MLAVHKQYMNDKSKADVHTVEPPNNGHGGSCTFVHYSEVSFMWRFFYVTILAASSIHYGL